MSAWFDDLFAFHGAIRGGEGMTGAACRNYPVATALEIYRNNYRGNLQGALALAYPVMLQLVGEGFFRMTAARYIESHPSRSGNLHDYGAEFGEFLGSFAPAQTLPYLADMAKLEWACHLAYFVADEQPFDVAALAQIEPENQAHLRFFFHPASRVIRSQFPIVTIWQAHQPDRPEDFHVDLDSGPQNALVRRQNDLVHVTELDDDDAEWLERIEEGAPLWAATAVILDRYPDFDLQSLLADLISQTILIDFDLEP